MKGRLTLPFVAFSFVIYLFSGSVSCGVYFQEITNDSGCSKEEDSAEMKMWIHKTFHQCGLQNECKFVAQNILTKEFIKIENEEELPQNRKDHRIWKKLALVTERAKKTAFKDCKEAFENGMAVDGIVDLLWDNGTTYKAPCNNSIDGGGWTVVQRRVDGTTSFERNWTDYVQGFGELERNFWLGLEVINQLTKMEEKVDLRIDLKRYNGQSEEEYILKCKNFKIRGEKESYRIKIHQCSPNNGAALINNARFYTSDQDSSNSCASTYKGGWWHCNKSCSEGNLNNLYPPSAMSNGKYMSWRPWKGNDGDIKFSEMKIRRRKEW